MIKPRYACVVSVGCGIYPPKKIGDFSMQLFGKHYLHIKKLKSQLDNLIKLLVAAVCVCVGVSVCGGYECVWCVCVGGCEWVWCVCTHGVCARVVCVCVCVQ